MTPSLFAPTRLPFAEFSECTVHPCCKEAACVGRQYRYLLGWPTAFNNDRVCLFMLANPSTASHLETDATVRRCIKWSERWGYGWCWVVNARAWRATHPKNVPKDPQGIGPQNDFWVLYACKKAERVVCGYGNLAGTRANDVLRIISAAGHTPLALLLNKDGSPAHPLTRRKIGEPFPMEMAEVRRG